MCIMIRAMLCILCNICVKYIRKTWNIWNLTIFELWYIYNYCIYPQDICDGLCNSSFCNIVWITIRSTICYMSWEDGHRVSQSAFTTVKCEETEFCTLYATVTWCDVQCNFFSVGNSTFIDTSVTYTFPNIQFSWLHCLKFLMDSLFKFLWRKCISISFVSPWKLK